MALRIEDYGLIGDCQSGALVGRNGSIDWLCLPRFDSGACFASLLGAPENGFWSLSTAKEPAEVKRRYRRETLILETEFTLADGSAVRLIDFMPIRKQIPDLVRIVEGLRGETRVRMELQPRFDYGSLTPWVSHGDHVVNFVGGPNRLTLRTSVPVQNKGAGVTSEFVVRKGQRRAFTLTWSPSFGPIPGKIYPIRALQSTENWWNNWGKSCPLKREWRDKVLRSLITLKALTNIPTGGIVAAPTTSLPEQIGGVRNWDYRFCWLRDASFTLLSLLGCGFHDEARAWLGWLLRATTGHPAELQVMYGLAGERMLPESDIHWLQGYESSRPVRSGNAATKQFQLDVFGEVLDAVHKWWSVKGSISSFGWALLTSMLGFLETVWRKPDEGIWEVRGPRRHFTHSKLMAWVAFDRGIDIAEKDGLEAPLEQWRNIREEIRHDILEKAFDQNRNSFMQYYGAKLVDASALRIPLVGFLPADDDRIKGTVAAIENKLLVGGYIQRYEPSSDVDGLPPGEGAFLMCTLWYADVLHMSGRKKEAHEVFERVLAISNDLGLLSEMYDVAEKRLVGNFPQAFSHVGIVNTALRLSGSGVVPEKVRRPRRNGRTK